MPHRNTPAGADAAASPARTRLSLSAKGQRAVCGDGTWQNSALPTVHTPSAAARAVLVSPWRVVQQAPRTLL